MLHIITRSPLQNSALQDCLAIAQPGDAVLLMDDATYAIQLPDLQVSNLRIYVLAEHAIARGISSVTWAGFIDYVGMVELTEQHHPIQSWY